MRRLDAHVLASFSAIAIPVALAFATLPAPSAFAAAFPHERWGGPGVRGPGAAGSVYSTVVTVGDGSARQGADGQLVFLAAGEAVETVPFTVPAGGTVQVTAPESLQGRGAFLVRALSAKGVSLWTETRNETPNGRFGVSVPGFAAHETLSAGDVALLAGGSGVTDPAGSRSNVGFLCLHGKACEAEVVASGPDGAEIGRGALRSEPLAVVQKALAELVPAAVGREGLALRVTGVSGRLRPYAVRNDNRTSDGVLVPVAIDRSEGSTFVFPLGCRLGSGCWIGNYVDRDPRAGSMRDYGGAELTYDGHEGTDYLVNGFAAMDLGVDVLAAASGIVVLAEDGSPDRCTGGCAGEAVNYVAIGHADGTLTAYFHLRKGSVLVTPGETVRRGQKIAEVGSSGSSSDPHLHFDWIDPQTVTYLDPFTTPADAWVTPWEEPAPYQGYGGLGVARMAVSRQRVDLSSWSLDPPAAGNLRRGDSVWIYLFVLRPEAGRRYTLEVRDGGGAVRASATEVPDESAAYAWLPVPVMLEGAAGDWELRLKDEDRLVKKVTLRVE
jgi:murein DD-endopeptidase MepM/ murein hydrolase activator NlpD